MKSSKLILLLLFFMVVINPQGIPQIQPINATLGTTTNYVLNYFSLKNIPSTTVFTINFANTDI